MTQNQRTITRETVEQLDKLAEAAYREWPDMAPMHAASMALQTEMFALLAVAVDYFRLNPGLSSFTFPIPPGKEPTP